MRTKTGWTKTIRCVGMALLCGVVLAAPAAQAGVGAEEGTLFHLKPALAAPSWIGEDWTFGVEVGGHVNAADVGYARFGYTPTEHALLFADLGFYSPESDDANTALQLGAAYRFLTLDSFNFAVRAAFSYPVVDNADLLLINADLAAWYACPRVRGLSVWLALGAGFYNWEVDGGFSDDGSVMLVSGGVDYEFLPGVAVGLQADYADDPMYGFNVRYRF